MKIKLSGHERVFHLLADLFALNLSFTVVLIVVYQSLSPLIASGYQLYLIFINFSWVLVANLSEFDPSNRRRRMVISVWEFIKAVIFNAIISFSFAGLINVPYSNAFIVQLFLVFFILGGSIRIGIYYYLKEYRKRGYNFKRMVVVGVNGFSREFVREVIRNPHYGYKFSGFFSYKEQDDPEFPVQSFEKIHSFLLEKNIHEVYIALPNEPDYKIKELIKFCHLNYININFLNEFIHLLNKKTIQMNLDYQGPTPIVSVAKEPLEIAINRIMKRAFDVGFSLILFIAIFSWLFPILAILVKLSSRGPVFFKQKRTGLDGRPFNCFKFRTMRPNDESDVKQATENDNRITKIGAFLRKTSLDELPQFYNVLVGDMSIVGPRPHMLKHTKLYAKIIEPFMVRHWVKPGITGLAQSKGFRGETKEVRQMYHRVKMDVFYIQNWFFLFDIQIIFNTAWNMIRNRNTGA